MKIQKHQFSSVNKVNNNINNTYRKELEKNQFNNDFQHILDNQVEEGNLVFSKHATIRLEDRGINLTEDQLEKLEQGLEKAKAKGIKDSLMLMDEIAFVVNTKSKVVITAMETDSKEQNTFTNIDGAVLL